MGADHRPAGDHASQLKTEGLIETLNSALLAGSSATTVLEQWCAVHHLASPAVVTARRDASVILAPSEDTRARLKLGPNETVGFRRVKLMCGDKVLSEANNWYAPARLTDAMNDALAHTTTPFGRVIAPFKAFRRTFSVERLWPAPPKDGAERPMDSTATAAPGTALFRHRALVLKPDGAPIAEVEETYLMDAVRLPNP
jgi:chorismate-pyruvate lyase